MSEVIVCQKHLQVVLTADAALAALVGVKIFGERSVQNTTIPYVVYRHMSTTDNDAIGGRSNARLVFSVEAVGEGESYSPLAPIEARFDTLLKGLIGEQDGMRLRWRRVGAIARYVMEGDRRVNYLGGQYRCFVS